MCTVLFVQGKNKSMMIDAHTSRHPTAQAWSLPPTRMTDTALYAYNSFTGQHTKKKITIQTNPSSRAYHIVVSCQNPHQPAPLHAHAKPKLRLGRQHPKSYRRGVEYACSPWRLGFRNLQRFFSGYTKHEKKRATYLYQQT